MNCPAILGIFKPLNPSFFKQRLQTGCCMPQDSVFQFQTQSFMVVVADILVYFRFQCFYRSKCPVMDWMGEGANF